jgi:hypothetical protein
MTSDEMKISAEKIAKVQSPMNGGKGYESIRHIIGYLSEGLLECAHIVRKLEFKWTRDFPELENVLRDALGCPDHRMKHCNLCKPLSSE